MAQKSTNYLLGSYQNITNPFQFIKTQQFIDLPEILSRHVTSLIWGQGIKINTSDDKIRKFFDDFMKRNKLNLLLQTNEKLLSKYGRSVILINRDAKGQIWLDIADPLWINKKGVISFSQDGKEVIVYKWIQINSTKVRVKETYTTDRVFYDYSPEADETYDITQDKRAMNRLGNPEFPRVWEHNLGILPLSQFINVPYAMFFTMGLDDSGVYPWVLAADDYPVRNLNFAVNETIRQSLIELYINKTRVYANMSKADRENLSNSAANIGLFTSELIIDVGNNPSGSPIEISSSAPKLQEYWQYSENLVKLYFQGSRYSSILGSSDESTQSTVVGNIFTQKADVETTKSKRLMRTDDLNDLLLKCAKAAGVVGLVDDREELFSVEISENNIINETAVVQQVIEQINNKLMTHIEGIAKLRSVTLQQAETIYKQIEKEQEQEIKKMQEQAEAQGLFDEEQNSEESSEIPEVNDQV